uniref:Outer membrane lipoprotein-sorting protein n=1 Tax=Candidatus Kentrum sp. TUN TaxID=2126343 RepID=A0A450ZBK9_9GAMM|nr:MAG: Protein of unknown function (DUF1329) [Candidatus Kentron sp. TUN]VFK52563.1 MAG: Protein of unknown function (DUF1329) [Candidatus Kentron sp. TUN]VFK53047.1 MAG: Protein of unknown function (DUF1329) [Candidatus Kentron sp. TUN]
MKTNKILILGTAFVLSLASLQSMAKMSAEEIAQLGVTLTPLGGEIAGNADGTIPTWDGGIESAADAGYPDFKPAGHHPDPYDNETPLFTITAGNMAQYADKLADGQKAMLQTYSSFSMNVYPSHRSAAYPQALYDITKVTAATARLNETGNGVHDAIRGIPFPIPKNGLEAIWNHILRHRIDRTGVRNLGQAPVLRNGDFTLVKIEDSAIPVYHRSDSTIDDLDNLIIKFKQKILAPPRLAGSVLLVHDTLDQFEEPRKAWMYNPGQRRVRRAPNAGFDTPGIATDGLTTFDQYDMYNGSPERYHWKLVGKQEMYVPYNAYRLHSDELKYTDIIKPLHLNPEHLRYELHRVWVVEATLKEDTRHIYKRRTFYIDEDSWQIMHVDQYDNRDQLWRVSEAHVINYYEIPVLWITVEAHHDLQSGRYLAFGLNNEEDFTFNFSASHLSESDFSVSALRRDGKR